MAALKSKNTTQMIFEINLFIRDQNYLFHLLLQWYMTQPPLTSGTFAANWRAIHAQPSQSAYLHSSPLSSQRSDLLRVWRDTVRCRWIRNDPRSAIPSHWQHCCHSILHSPLRTIDDCSRKLLQKQSSFGWSILIDHIVRTRISKFTYGSFIHIVYDSSNPDHQHRS